MAVLGLVSLLLIFISAFVAGIFGSLLGIGGGIFLTPLLTLIFKLPIHYAIGTSIIAVIATSSAATEIYTKAGFTNLRLGMFLEVATTLGAVTGSLTAALISLQSLNILFALVLFYTSGSLFFSLKRQQGPASEVAATWVHQEAIPRIGYRVAQLPAGALISFLAGNLSGLLGCGGGIIKIPTMTQLMQVPIKAAIATSSFMVGVTAAASAFIYYSRGYINPFYAAPAAIGVFLGAQVGSHMAKWVRNTTLQKAFVFLLIYLAGSMLWEGLFKSP